MAATDDGVDRQSLKTLENEERMLSARFSPTMAQQQQNRQPSNKQQQHSNSQQDPQQHFDHQVHQAHQDHQDQQDHIIKSPHYSPPAKLLAMESITSSTTTTPPLNHHMPLCGEVQIISAAGSHIIAVTNPALIMSPTLNDAISLKRETNLESRDL